MYHKITYKLLGPLNSYGEVLGIIVRPSLLIMSLSKCNILVPNLIMLEYFVDNGYAYLLSVKFSYKQVNHLLECRKEALLLHHLKNS